MENEFQRMGRKPREARQWEISQSQTPGTTQRGSCNWYHCHWIFAPAHSWCQCYDEKFLTSWSIFVIGAFESQRMGEKIYIPVCIRVLQRNKPIWYYFILLRIAQVIVKAERSKILRAGWQPGNSGKSWCESLESEFHRAGQVAWKLSHSFYVAVMKLKSFSEKFAFALHASNWLMKFT